MSVVELPEGGSVINGATLSSFLVQVASQSLPDAGKLPMMGQDAKVWTTKLFGGVGLDAIIKNLYLESMHVWIVWWSWTRCNCQKS